MVGMLFNGKIKKLADIADKNSTIFFITTGEAKSKWDRTAVRHILSASDNQNLPSVLAEFRKHLDVILK